MAIFKCKMCGGSLDVSPNDTIVECDYCGIKQTIPRLDSEKRANYYDRADHYRRQNDYDKAMSIYEQILAEDNTDAEAYWSIVLCRYGVEYVKDPVTGKHVPTINRTQSTSILADPDYQSALQHADGYQRDVYAEQANEIHEIQKGILAISQREEPFDVFICYKESDSAGRRTPDSVLAQELYYELGEMGYRVFFARITLEDKLGSAYEPYIFAALQSAKVMVVLGTKSEYFEAVWVRNEWSRFLGLMQNGEDKILIPAYRDMDPYDLPREFSHLQAQDMSKLGFMQDLIRGISKLVPRDADRYFHGEPQGAPAVISSAMIPNYLKRISMFVADGLFDEANEYCDKVLDLDPENADAYLYVLLAADKVRCKDVKELAFLDFDFTKLPQYQRAYRFANKERKAQLDSYAKPVLERLAEQNAEQEKNEQRARVENMIQRRRGDLTRLIDQKNKDLISRQRALQSLSSPGINAASLQSQGKTPNLKTWAVINLLSIGAFLLAVLIFAVGVPALGVLFLLGYVLGSLFSSLKMSRAFWPQYTMEMRLVFYLISFNIVGLYLAIQILRGKTSDHVIGEVQSPASANTAQRRAALEHSVNTLTQELGALRRALDRLPRSTMATPVEDLPQLEQTLQEEEARSLYQVVIRSCNDMFQMVQTLNLHTKINHDTAMRLLRSLPACIPLSLPAAEAKELHRRLSANGRVDLVLCGVHA